MGRLISRVLSKPVFLIYLAATALGLAAYSLLANPAAGLAVIGGLFEVFAARTGLAASREKTEFPRLTYHLILIGFLFLTASSVLNSSPR